MIKHPSSTQTSWRALVLLLAGFFLGTSISIAQTQATATPPSSGTSPGPQASPTPSVSPTPSLEKEFFSNILKDQRAIITSPFHLHKSDARYLAPFGVATAALLATDRRSAGELGYDQTRQNISNDVSRIGEFYTTGGIAATFYLVGRAAHDQRARETGLLGAEALIDSGIDVEALKLITQRERPTQNNGQGRFFQGGSSFPSGHAISAWSLATVIAEEYHEHPFVRVGVYGVAAAVSVSRFTGRNHFLSDILVGSVMGYGIGHFVYKRHHDRGMDTGIDTGDGEAVSKEPQRLFPTISPLYNARARMFAITLAWRL